VGASKNDWIKIGKGNNNLEIALDWMYEYLKNAPLLGSMLNPPKSDAAMLVQWSELSEIIEEVMKLEDTPEWYETAVAAQGMAKTVKLLTAKYHWIITNPPYLTRNKQNDDLKNRLEENYPKSKNDIATAFLERCFDFCEANGITSIVLPQNWLFLSTYKYLREYLLKGKTWHLIARLGPGAFQTITGEVVKAILLIMGNDNPNIKPELIRNLLLIHGLDVSEIDTIVKKDDSLVSSEIKSVHQIKQLKNPDARITMENTETQNTLSEFAICPVGIVSGDGNRWYRQFWEILEYDNWIFLKGTTEKTLLYSGLDKIVDWSDFGDKMIGNSRNNPAYKKTGVSINLVGNLPVTIYCGWFYDQTTASIVPKDKKNLLALFCYCSSTPPHSATA
jgi:hypothetical protein